VEYFKLNKIFKFNKTIVILIIYNRLILQIILIIYNKFILQTSVIWQFSSFQLMK